MSHWARSWADTQWYERNLHHAAADADILHVMQHVVRTVPQAVEQGLKPGSQALVEAAAADGVRHGLHRRTAHGLPVNHVSVLVYAYEDARAKTMKGIPWLWVGAGRQR